ncbi:MAG: sigma-70 family RNA polymerase sigma factor [Acidobacteria bacterium]|nr:sigma-70 family RNA polymerase sigma factor [Acidobacteriota bacterium]
MGDRREEPLTALLLRWRSGDSSAGAELFALTYDNLRRLASQYMKSEAPGHTLQPTALVHELYLRLTAGNAVEWKDRAHFFGVAARQLRLLLIDYARARTAESRGGGQVIVALDEALDAGIAKEQALLDLEEALQRLEKVDPRIAQLIELRFFAGLTMEEAAEVLNVSLATTKRDWAFARAWLLRALTRQ